MNPFALSCLLIVFTALPLGYFVYAQNKTRWMNRLWFLYSFSLCVWGYFGMLIAATDNQMHALIYWRIAMGLGVIWMPVLFYHFAYLYAPWKEKKLLIGAYVITALFALSAATSYYIPAVTWRFGAFYYGTPGIAFYGLTVWWFLLTGYSHTKLWKASKQMPKERQNQIKYFIIASCIGYFGGLHDFSIIYGVNIYPWSNFVIVAYPFIMTYAIIRHGLFDIFIFIKRAFYSAIAVGVIAWLISSIGVWNGYLQDRFGVAPWLAPVLAAIAAVYVIYLFIGSSRKADKVKQEFITVAAHKLRTPLTHVGYIADELAEVQTVEAARELGATLKNSNSLLVDMVNKLLSATNLETQVEKYQFTSLDISAITRDILENMKPLMHHKKIDMSVNISENLPHVEGYEKSARFVIQSLAENALMYTPEGGKVGIDVSSDKKNVTWSITDTGIGIAKEDIEKVFDKFFRGQNALKVETEGTGLALSMARNLLKRQGGHMKVESEGIGHGSHFWFTLPVAGK